MLRRVSQWSALVGVAGAVAASPAAAQTLNPAAVLESLDFGAIANRLSVTATADGAYDSNVSRSDAAVAAARGLKVDDEIFSPTLLVDILQPVGRNTVFLTGTAGYNFYNHNTILNREDIGLRGGFNATFGRCRGTLTAGYERRQNDLDYLGRGKVQDTYDNKSVALNASCGREFGLQPIASVAEFWANNTGALLTSSDYRTFSSSAGVGYQTPTLGVLSLFGQYQTTYFENRLLISGGGSLHDGYDLFGGGLRYERVLGARIQGVASVTYSQVSTTQGGSNFSGLTYDINASYRASSRISFEGSFTRAVLPANTLDAAYRIVSNSRISANYRAGSRLSFNLGAADGSSKLNGSALIPDIDLAKTDDKSIFGSANYDLRRLSFGLSVKNDRRTANLNGLNYWDTRVDLRVSARY